MNTPSASGITLVDVATGDPLPFAPSGSALLSSAPFGWRGMTVERHSRDAQEMPEHYVVGHGLAVSTGARPIAFGWKDGKTWREGAFNPGEFHLVTNGERNTPRWLQALDETLLVLDPRFLADVVGDGFPPDRIEFATQRSACDVTIVRYTEASIRGYRHGCALALRDREYE